MSQKELSKKTGVAQSIISDWKRKKTKPVSEKILIICNQKERSFIDLYFSRVPPEENGFKGFDYDKFCTMVLFFANRSTELLKTKLMKFWTAKSIH